MRRFLAVKAVPIVAWSAERPLSFKPRLHTVGALSLGLVIFGIGEAFLIKAGLGVSPWTVFAQGISRQAGIGIGWSTFTVSLMVLLLWIPLKQMPGLGTLLNAILIAAALELSLPYLPQPESLMTRLMVIVLGILLVGIGSGMYLIAHLGPGPRDGLMTGLQRLTNYPIAWVRLSIECSVVVFGWLLGGSVGLGTLLFAAGIGPAVSVGLYLVGSLSGASFAEAPGKQSE